MAFNELSGFQQAANTYLDMGQLQNQRLQMLSNQGGRGDDELAREQFEYAKRLKEKEEYAQWEKEQILNQVASELFEKSAGKETGVTDSKGNMIYKETPLSQAEQYIAAAKEAARRGNGAAAQEFMSKGQVIAQAEEKARQDAEQTRLENEKLRAETKLQLRKAEAGYRDGADVMSETDKQGNLRLIDKTTGEVFKTIEGAGKPATGVKSPEELGKAEIASRAMAGRLIEKVDQALSKVSGTTSGTGFALTPESLETITGAKDLSADLATIKANLGFAELQAMREASPTGGALGQIAVQELVALQSTLASLDQAQSPSQLKERLGEIKTHYQNWQSTMEGKIPKGSDSNSFSDGPPPGAVRRKN
jgi:hypothetical protein